MQLTINGEIREVAEGTTLRQLVTQLSLQEKGMAMAVNQQVIARESWQSHELQEKDAVFIIRATHGG